MKLKSFIGSVLSATLLSSIPFNASAADLTPVPFSGTTFSDLYIGSITIDSLSNLDGLVFAADKVGTPWGSSFTLDSVTFSSSSVGSLAGDLNPSSSAFSFKNVAQGVYSVLVSGSLSHDGQIHDVAFIGANYTVTAVPEPGSYAMFFAGLGLMGVIARRRSNA